MTFNRSGSRAQKSFTSKRGLNYERFEDRRLLAADLGLAGNAPTLLDQLAVHDEAAWTQKGLNQLVQVASESTSTGTTTVFQQQWNGLPVFDSWVTVVQDGDGEITNVRDHAKQNIRGYALDSDPISSRKATRIGSQDLGSDSTLDSSTSLAWYYAGNKARLSWLVETTVFDTDGEISGEFDTWVNLFDGSIFHREAKASTISELLSAPLTETGVFPRIVINDAIGAAGSRSYAAPFDSVAFMSVGCTGTLISANTVITARHCGMGAGDTVSFGDNSNSPDATFSVASALEPAGGNAGSPLLDGGDVTILTLTSDVPASVASPMRFIDATTDLVSMTAVTVGYGYNGVGSSGHGFTADGWRWGGENIIDAFGSPSSSSGSNIISTDFDDGSAGSNTIGSSSSTPLTLEATTAPGDSGGPILVDVDGEWVIAGVLSGGTTSNSVYGDISWWTGTAIYRTEIENAGGVFVGDGAGSVRFDSESYFVGDAIEIRVLDGNVTGDITVTVTSDSGDSETLTISPTTAGSYLTSIDTSEDGANAGDGILQVTAGDEIQVTYTDVDDGDGNSVDRTDTANVTAVAPPALIGIDFDEASASSPTNWLGLSGSGTTNDLSNEEGGASQVDITITGSSTGYAFALNANTIPQYTNDLTNLDGQIYTEANPIEFTYSDLEPLKDYYVYVMSAEGFYAAIQQTVSIQGDGSPVSFEQRFDIGDLFINDQVGDSTRDLTEYAQVITADSNGVITINVDPISGTEDVVVSGLGVFQVPEPLVAPDIVINNTEVDRSVLNEVVISFDDIVTLGTNAFEVVKRGTDGGVVDVTPTIDNSSGSSVVTLSFSGTYTESSGSLVDGNYQLTLVGDQITSSNGTAVDGDGDGVAGGNMVFGDTATDNFFRFFGDADGNRSVNVFDLLPLRQAWNSSSGDSNFDARFDANGDGSVNVFDLLPFRQNYLGTLDFE